MMFGIKKSKRKVINHLLVFLVTGAVIMANGLMSQENKIKITRVATIDLFGLIEMVKDNETLRRVLSLEDLSSIKKVETLQREVNTILEKMNRFAENSPDNDQLKSKLERLYKELDQILGEKLRFSLKRPKDLPSEVVRNLYRLIKKEALNEGYSLVIDSSSAIVYRDNDIDLTSTIERLLNLLSGACGDDPNLCKKE